MALIKCPECGREVSDKAAACPQCGAPVVAQAAAPATPSPAPAVAAPAAASPADEVAGKVKLPGTENSSRKPPKPTTSSRLVGIVVAILFVLGFGFVVGPAKELGHWLASLAMPEAPSEWPPDFRQKLLAPLRGTYTLPFPLDERSKVEIANCMFEELTRAIPGGPREAQRLGQAKLEEVEDKAGRECAYAYARRVVFSKEWIPQFAPLYTFMCVLRNGESEKEHCSCAAREAPRHFGSPAAFMEFEGTPDARLTAAERATFLKMRAACFVRPRP